MGRLDTEKNLFTLLLASRIGGFGIDLVGAGPLYGELEAFARTHKVDIRFLGTFSNAEMPEIYRKYWIFVLPSLYEGSPKALLEAMSCGMAAVGTPAQGIYEILEHEVTGLLAENHPGALAQAIRRLIDDPGLREKLGLNARESVVRNYSLEKIAPQEEGVLARLLLARTPAPL